MKQLRSGIDQLGSGSIPHIDKSQRELALKTPFLLSSSRLIGLQKQFRCQCNLRRIRNDPFYFLFSLWFIQFLVLRYLLKDGG